MFIPHLSTSEQLQYRTSQSLCSAVISCSFAEHQWCSKEICHCKYGCKYKELFQWFYVYFWLGKSSCKKSNWAMSFSLANISVFPIKNENQSSTQWFPFPTPKRLMSSLKKLVRDQMQFRILWYTAEWALNFWLNSWAQFLVCGRSLKVSTLTQNFNSSLLFYWIMLEPKYQIIFTFAPFISLFLEPIQFRIVF
jgi:hypothetical protein